MRVLGRPPPTSLSISKLHLDFTHLLPPANLDLCLCRKCSTGRDLPATSVIMLSMVRRQEGTPWVTLAHALGGECDVDDHDADGDDDDEDDDVDDLVPLLPPTVMHSSLLAVPPISTLVSRPWLIVHLPKCQISGDFANMSDFK